MRFHRVVLALVLTAIPMEALPGDDADAVALVKRLGGRVTRKQDAEGKPVVIVDLRSTLINDAD